MRVLSLAQWQAEQRVRVARAQLAIAIGCLAAAALGLVALVLG